ncbi:MAG: response regulator [Firmicutes bacterium]|nr:response regulator [Bacillota bacterium]
MDLYYKLLLVDDEKSILNKMCFNTNWKKEGYRSFAATNGKEALDIIKKEDIDILVTDIKMPKLNGMELIEKIRRVDELLKIIVISGFAEFEYAQKSIKYGVSNYILKPFSSQKLLTVVNDVREALVKEKKNKQSAEDLRNEILKNIQDKQKDSFCSLIISNQFFQQQITILSDIEFEQVLKSGNKEDIMVTVGKIISNFKKDLFTKEEYIIVFSNLILEAYKIIKGLGYGVKDLLCILNDIEIEKINFFKLLEVEGLLKDFLIKLHNLISLSYENKRKELINKMKEYIAKNYQDGITLSKMAEVFNFSTSHLSNLFYEETGEHFSDYINMLKLKKAKELLKTTNYKIYEIANQLGFNDAFYFSTWFKKLVGVSPTIYKENIKLF